MFMFMFAAIRNTVCRLKVMGGQNVCFNFDFTPHTVL